LPPPSSFACLFPNFEQLLLTHVLFFFFSPFFFGKASLMMGGAATSFLPPPFFSPFFLRPLQGSSYFSFPFPFFPFKHPVNRDRSGIDGRPFPPPFLFFLPGLVSFPFSPSFRMEAPSDLALNAFSSPPLPFMSAERVTPPAPSFSPLRPMGLVFFGPSCIPSLFFLQGAGGFRSSFPLPTSCLHPKTRESLAYFRPLLFPSFFFFPLHWSWVQAWGFVFFSFLSFFFLCLFLAVSWSSTSVTVGPPPLFFFSSFFFPPRFHGLVLTWFSVLHLFFFFSLFFPFSWHWGKGLPRRFSTSLFLFFICLQSFLVLSCSFFYFSFSLLRPEDEILLAPLSFFFSFFAPCLNLDL